MHGGIILTGGGAQLKHLVQLTEYVTGLGCRLGYPNEHLAGGHSENLMNPMYSTCIGLILRGYHDFETGKMRFVGEGGNYISVPEVAVDEMDHSAIITDEDEEDAEQASRKRPAIKKLFESFKGKFMSIFEEVEYEEIN